jgi:alkaline phosphatase D
MLRPENTKLTFIRYIPNGSSKFGSFTIEKLGESSLLKFDLYIDGQERWSTVVSAPPAAESESSLSALWSKIKFHY